MKIIITESQHNLLLESKASKYKQINYPYMDVDTFNWVVSLDKTSSNIENDIIGKYAIWLLKLFDSNNGRIFKYADKISEYFEYYNNNLSKFEVKDIFQYKNISMFLYDVEEVKKASKAKVTSKDYTKFYEDNDWLVIIPHTVEASCKYGSNTKWCTSSKNNNQFHNYNPIERGGPLYYFINKKTHKKYSYHQKDGYRNDQDETINNIPDLPLNLIKIFIKQKLENKKLLNNEEYNLLTNKIKLYYVKYILDSDEVLSMKQFSNSPLNVKLKQIRYKIKCFYKLQRYEMPYLTDKMKRKYGLIKIKYNFPLYDYEFEILSDDLKIKYIENTVSFRKIEDDIFKQLSRKMKLYYFNGVIKRKIILNDLQYKFLPDKLKESYLLNLLYLKQPFTEIQKSDFERLNVKSNNVIYETPDEVYLGDDEPLTYDEYDSITFGFHNNIAYIAKQDTHSNIWRTYNILSYEETKLGEFVRTHRGNVRLIPGKRNDFSYPGRLWFQKHIITFWNYPPKHILPKLLFLLSFEMNKIYDITPNFNKYLIEVYDEDYNSTLIPIKYYKGSAKIDNETIHLMKPEDKRNTPQMIAKRDYDLKLKAEKFKKTPEYEWNFWKNKNISENMNETQPTITFLIGPPASGKSTWVEKNGNNATIISRDDIVDELRKPLNISYASSFKDKDFQDNVNSVFKSHVDTTLNSGQNIIVDMTNMNKKSRSNILSKVPKNYIKNAVVFKVDRDELIKRLNKRKLETGKEVGINIVDDMMNRFEMPDHTEFDNIIEI